MKNAWMTFVGLLASAGVAQAAAPRLQPRLIDDFTVETGQSFFADFEEVADAPAWLAASHDDSRPASISDYEIEQFLAVVARLESPLQQNQRIEECYERNRHQLTWRQVRRLLDAVKYYSGNHYYDEIAVNGRIVDSYLRQRKAEIGPELAATIAAAHKKTVGVNELLEVYFLENRQRLSWEDLRTLLGTIRYFSGNNHYDEIATNNRMVSSYMQAQKSRIPTSIAVKVASAHKSPLGTNELLESYFMENKSSLSWDEVQQLLAAIKYYSGVNYYDEIRTKERIVQAYGCRLCRP